MKGLVFHGPEDIRFESVPDPEILSPDDVIVKVRLSAICGSDLHIYFGRECGLDSGTVMGHEMIGDVVAVGKSVRALKQGDTVICPFTTNCGRCYYCRIGLTCRCSSGRLFGWCSAGEGLQGTQAEFVRVPHAESTLTRLPEDLKLEEGLFLGDILATGYFCADQAEIRPGGTYALIGCGPVGLMAVGAALSLGAERLYALDVVPERLALAERFGAIPLDCRTNDPVAVLRDATDGRGADAILEAVGSDKTSRLALNLVRPGGVISSVGVNTSPHMAFSPMEAYDKNLTFKTGRCPVRAYLDRILGFVRSRTVDVTEIISHRTELAQGAAFYSLFAARKDGCTKVVFDY